MTMTAKSNTEMRQILSQMLGADNPFSTKGLHYLACRLLGSKYQKTISTTINAMREGTLQDLIPNYIKEKIAEAFNYEGKVPDPALVIISAARRAIKGNKGWDEAGYSLLNLPVIPNDLETFDKKTQDKILKLHELRVRQKEACVELMDFLNMREAVVIETTTPVVEEAPVVEASVVEAPAVKATKRQTAGKKAKPKIEAVD